MRNYILLFLSTTCFIGLKAADTDSTVYYTIPDSIKAISFCAEVKVQTIHPKKETSMGIRADDVSLSFEAHKKERKIEFEFPATAIIVAKGIDVEDDKDELEWKFNWNPGESYHLMITTATDSALNFVLYSGYIYFPVQNKWRLVGTCKITGRWGTVKSISTFYTKNKNVPADYTGAWLQRNNGSWKNMLTNALTPPVINPMSNIDSTKQAVIDQNIIEVKLGNNKNSYTPGAEGLYYRIISEGAGRQVKLGDTVTVFYKGYLLADGAVFDQTKEKPATFPLNRLIRGWQIGVPLCKVGGKTELIIPSGIAYGIRTRAAKIPPNSVLVFEIEVVDAK